MALSNWDHFIMYLDEDKKELHPDVDVELYKNFLYLRDKVGWTKDSPFIFPTIAQIYEVNMNYKGIEIKAVRGPQNGVYCAVYHGYKDVVGFVACGVYGFKDEEFVGVTKESMRWFEVELKKWLKNYDIPEDFEKINLSKGKRYNQGDAFFADHLGRDKEDVSTEPGKAEKTMFSKLIEGGE